MDIKVSDVRIHLVNRDENKMKAFASITINDCFVVHEIRIIEGENGLFAAMPSRKTPDGKFKDIAHPIKTEVRKYIEQLVLDAYSKEVKK